MRIYLAQENPKIGDLVGNAARLRQLVQENTQASLLVFPELYLTGYPPGDLLFNSAFLQAVKETIAEIQNFTQDHSQLTLVVGAPWQEGGRLFNSALVLQGGSILGVQHKRELTRLRLFDEFRYFSPGKESVLFDVGGFRIGLALGREVEGLGAELKEKGADLIVNPCALPFSLQELGTDLSVLARGLDLPIVRAGQVGANDALVFPGKSGAAHSSGNAWKLLPEFEVGGVLVDLAQTPSAPPDAAREVEPIARVYQALVLGIRDYVKKNGMRRVIIGLSGGLDSAVSACLAAEALGPEHVWGVTQPGPYSSPSSAEDAQALAENLGIKFDVLPITQLYQAALTALAAQFAGTEMNVAEENIQARLRGDLLMALSNKFGGLVLVNSNKSELAVGYCTLYGDMSGGLAPLGDVYKTMVYELAYYINREREIIPWNTIEKPPSAELRPNQRDDQSLPPYEILDGILRAYLDEGLSTPEIIARGYAEETVHWVVGTVERNEYKRRQAALILRITTPLLGSERSMPLTAVKQV